MDTNFRIENTHVPDKVYAYMIQAHHMLYELADCKKGDAVSLEVFDDNGVVRENGTVEAIQIKSVNSERNPVSNRATDLWKTLYNWLMAVKMGELQLKNTKYRLFITVDNIGSIVSSFHNAKDDESAEEAWTVARSEFYDEENKEKEFSETYGIYVRTFFDIGNKDIAIKIIKNFALETCETTYSETVRNKLKQMIPYEDLFEILYKALLGWINEIVAECVEKHKPIVVTKDDFDKEYYLLFREYNQKCSLVSSNCIPNAETVDRELSSNKCYITQLELIKLDYEDILEAINDYFCAAVDRARWAKDSIVSRNQFLAYDKSLKRNWNNKKHVVKSEQVNRTEEEFGYRVYSCCMDGKVEMDSYIVPDSFYAGCMHALSDKLEIGWHPKYKEILEGEVSGNEPKQGTRQYTKSGT